MEDCIGNRVVNLISNNPVRKELKISYEQREKFFKENILCLASEGKKAYAVYDGEENYSYCIGKDDKNKDIIINRRVKKMIGWNVV